MSRTGIIVPIRSLQDGKTRLAPVLAPHDREALNRSMLAGVLEAAGNLVGDNEIIVVSPDQAALGFAEFHAPGTTRLFQSPDHPLLIGALDQATEYAMGEGLRTILIVPADLPFVKASDLQHLLRRDAPIVVAPDRHNEGTNSLMQRLDATRGRFRYKFGTGSYQKHMTEAHRLGLDPATAVSFGTSFDLDTPADLEIAASSSSDHFIPAGVESVAT